MSVRCARVVVAFGAILLAAGDEKMQTFRFAKEDEGKLPRAWTAAHTGTGQGSVWRVVADATAPSQTGFALAQTAAAPNAYFNICVANETQYNNLEIEVAFKAVRGELDQGGGLVWRYKDGNNYYIARMNPLEENFRVYKVVEGKRRQLTTQEDLKVPAGEWHRIKVRHLGDHIECWLDGKKLPDAHDSTFADSGKVGLWTKADAQSYFDDLTVREVK